MRTQKFLDKRSGIRYNELIKNWIGTKSNLIRLEKKNKLNSKKVLDKRFKFEYNEFIKNGVDNQFIVHNEKNNDNEWRKRYDERVSWRLI